MRTLLLLLLLMTVPASAQVRADQNEMEGTRSMTGYIRTLGPNIFMQGTHALESEDGRTLALLDGRGSGLDLNEWVGKKVEVTGRAQASVEGNQTVLHVERVEPR